MISLCICQPCVPERRSGLLDHPTLRFSVSFSIEWHVFYLSPMYTSWPAVWHYRPFDQCWSQFVRANWRGLYGITDRSISVDRGLYGPIGVGCMALQTVRSVLVAVCTGQLAWAVWHYKPFHQCWSRSVRANWRGLYGITDRSISVDRGLYRPIGMSCMALQTVPSVLIAICTGQLAFRRCSPSILKK
jgi:hypothetical protein